MGWRRLGVPDGLLWCSGGRPSSPRLCRGRLGQDPGCPGAGVPMGALSTWVLSSRPYSEANCASPKHPSAETQFWHPAGAFCLRIAFVLPASERGRVPSGALRRRKAKRAGLQWLAQGELEGPRAGRRSREPVVPVLGVDTPVPPGSWRPFPSSSSTVPRDKPTSPHECFPFFFNLKNPVILLVCIYFY